MNPVAVFSVIFLMVGSGFAAAFTWEKFRSELERFHPEEWAKAGAPPFSGYIGYRRRRQFGWYLMRGRYREAHNARLTRLGDNAQAGWYVCRIVIVGLLLAMFAPLIVR